MATALCGCSQPILYSDEVCIAARDGDLSTLRDAVRRKPELANADDFETSRTVLQISIIHKRRNVTSWLLQHGARVNTQDADGQTALHFAAESGDGEAVQLLLRNGADPTIRDNDNLTAADTARQHGHSEIAALIAQAAKRKAK